MTTVIVGIAAGTGLVGGYFGITAWRGNRQAEQDRNAMRADDRAEVEHQRNLERIRHQNQERLARLHAEEAELDFKINKSVENVNRLKKVLKK